MFRLFHEYAYKHLRYYWTDTHLVRLFWNMQRVSLLRRIANTAVLGEKAVLRRNIFTMEGPWKVPCFKMSDTMQEKVTKLKNIYMDGHYQNTE
jgi:hypothetical protein